MRQFIKGMSACAFLVLALNTSAFAKGGEVGNGGDVFQCQNSKSVLVDVYEAQAERGIKLDLGPPRLALFSKVDMAIKRLARLSPIRAKMYSDQAHNFFNEASLIPDAQLTPIQDVYNWATPDGCVLKQIAVQIVPQFPQDKRYLISKDLWDTLDDDSKAALILHEVIYREAISLGFTNSISVRYFNSLIFSHELDKATPKDFVATLQSLPFVDFQVGDIPIEIWTVTYGSSVRSTSFTYDDQGNVTQVVPVTDITLPSGLVLTGGGDPDILTGTGLLTLLFSPTGKLIEAQNAGFYPGPTSGDIFFDANESWSSIHNASLWIGLTPLRFRMEELDATDFNGQGQLVQDKVVQITRYTGAPLNFVADESNGPMTANFSASGDVFDIVNSTGSISLKVNKNVVAGDTFAFSVKKLSFYKDGYLAKLDTLGEDLITYEIRPNTPPNSNAYQLKFKAGTSLEFWPGKSLISNVKEGTLAEAANLVVVGGAERQFNAGDVVDFDMNGFATTPGSR